MTDTALLGVDWGSSSLRAFRIAADGSILDVRRSADGVFTGKGSFDARLRAVLGDWLGDGVPILLCGMVGSDRGWLHAPYVPAPAGAADLARAMVRTPFERPAWIVPGVSFADGDGREVMRGEEALIVGLQPQRATVCLPGTHSKWADIADGRIVGFRTYVTGELRSALLEHGALATGVAQQPSADAFAQGVRAAVLGVTRALFQARARRLLGTLAPEHAAAFVDGVLIGEEVARETASEVVLAARGAIAESYAAALALGGRAFSTVDPEPLAARGLFELARQAGIVAAV
ncbi:MAG: 2-dehydro-3-deoxygalactonokinase [Rhizomicrobium sp.]